jgi:dTDP-glucose 4,6-dehydratase
VLEATGKELPLVHAEQRVRPAGSEVDRLCASVEKARERLGWQALVSFKEGLQATIDWISSSLHLYKSTIYNV